MTAYTLDSDASLFPKSECLFSTGLGDLHVRSATLHTPKLSEMLEAMTPCCFFRTHIHDKEKDNFQTKLY
jgi:hypothetical protein